MAFQEHIVRAGLADLSREDLIEIIVEQARRLHELTERLEALERAAHRPTAPHQRPAEKRAKQPKRPGRKGGHHGCYRPRPETVDSEIEAPLTACPHCAGPVGDVRPLVQYIEDVPAVRPHVTRLVRYRGRCPSCGPVVSTHPLAMSQASGAAAVQLGANALARAAELIFDLGLTRRKAARLLKQSYGLSLSPSGLQQAADRLAGRLRPRYAALKAALREAAVVHADETGWYLGTAGGEPRAWLWVFCHREATIYQVERRRARAVVEEVLGDEFTGVLVSDCLNIYDDVTRRQQKCYSHHLKAISQARAAAEAAGVSSAWLAEVRSLLQAALGLKRASSDLSPSLYGRYCRQLEQRADVVLARAGRTPWDQAVAKRLGKQRDHLFEFLYDAAVDATNNLAERQLRPAVVTRKLSCGNRSAQGAATWSVLASLAATARQQGTTLAEWIVKELRGEPIPALEALLQR